MNDERVIGVTPFLLAGKFWEKLGDWPWMREKEDEEGSLVPTMVYTAVKQLRCSLFPDSSC
jgi:hypothetical protein